MSVYLFSGSARRSSSETTVPLLLFSMGTMACVIGVCEVDVGASVCRALKIDANDGCGWRSAVSLKHSSAACVSG
jgi:hypothetical protein